jgi:hypothetical protein
MKNDGNSSDTLLSEEEKPEPLTDIVEPAGFVLGFRISGDSVIDGTTVRFATALSADPEAFTK